MSEQSMDTFICVHKRDAGYLLESVLRSYLLNFRPRRKLTLITNDQAHLKTFLSQTGLEGQVQLSGDEDWLSQAEMSLPGWYRQQIIKLRAYQFCETYNFCNLGADTMMLRPIEESDLVKDDFPVLYYTRHMPPDLHYIYEWMRVGYIGQILGVKPGVSRRYVDFINDLFCFNRSALLDLNRYLEKRYGPNYYYKLIQPLGTDPRNQKKFGEWTLYSLYLLEVARQEVEVRSSAGFLRQVHSLRMLNKYRFDSKVVHFVGKDFDVDYIKTQIAQRDYELGRHLLQAEA